MIIKISVQKPIILVAIIVMLLSMASTQASPNRFPSLEPIGEDNIDKLQPISTLQVPSQIWDIEISISRDGYVLAVAVDRSVHIWRIGDEADSEPEEGRPIQSSVPIAYIAFGEPSKLITINKLSHHTPSDEVVIWDIEAGEQDSRFDLSDAAWASEVSPNLEQLAVGYSDGSICLWNLETGIEQTCLIADHAVEAPSVSLAFSPTEPLLAVGNAYHGLQLWDLETEELIFDHRKTLGGFGPVVAFSADGQYLAVAHDDGSPIEVYNMTLPNFESISLEHLDTLAVYRNALVFTSDGKVLIADDQANGLWFWDVETQEQIRYINIDDILPVANDAFLQVIAISSDDRILATGDDEGNIILWGIPEENTQ